MSERQGDTDPPPGRMGVTGEGRARRDDPPGDTGSPAPVVTDQGAYGDLPRLYEEYEELGAGDESDWRRSLTWIGAVALAIIGAAWALTFTAERATSPTVALPFHERAIEALTGLDGLLVVHEDAIRDTAEGAAPPETIDVPGFPVRGIGLAAFEVHEEDRETWHALLIERSARAAYRDGLAIFHDESAPETGGIFTTSGSIARMVDTLSEDRHAQAERASTLIAYVVLALVAAVALAGRGTQRFVAVGGSLIAAAGLVAIGGLITMAAVALLAPSGGTLADEFTSMATTLARMPLWAALYLAIGGGLILIPAAVMSYVLRAFERRRGRAGAGDAAQGSPPA